MKYKNIKIIIEQIPENTPKDAKLYISGDFNGWFPNVSFYEALRQKDGTFKVTLRNIGVDEFQYKFTRGTWDSSECGTKGAIINNRAFIWEGTTEFRVKIKGWEDLQESKTSNVKLISDKFSIPQLKRNRRIWIYLPPDYFTSTKHYPVLYLHDGQELFETLSATDGEWAVDKTLNKFSKSGCQAAIVVGIENGLNYRDDEYTPVFDNSDSDKKSDSELYLEFIVSRLKPYIDKYYRTKPESEHTGMGGAQKAANLTLFASLKYSQIFGRVFIFSPEEFFCDDIVQFIEKQKLNNKSKFYITTGFQKKSEIPKIQKLIHILEINGMIRDNLRFEPQIDGKAETWFWRREFPKAFLWLFANID